MSTVNHQQAWRLAALGYPQTHTPQRVWTLWESVPNGVWALQWAEVPEHSMESGGEWYAAPVYVAGDGGSGALEFVERDHGWRWMRLSPRRWLAVPHAGGGILNARSASELLDLMLDRLEAAPPAAKEGP